MKRILVLLLLIITQYSHTRAQSFKDRTFHNIGFSPYLDFIWGPITLYSYTSNNVSIVEAMQNSGVSLFTFIYRYRYNVYELSDNMAISLALTPATGVSVFSNNIVDVDGGFHFTTPLMVGMEFGAGSTYNSVANMGGYLGFGFEFTVAPLIGGNVNYTELTKSWIEPVVSAGVRYWSKKNKLREINVKYGWKSSDIPSDAIVGKSFHSGAMTIRLSWMKFLNY